jgi:hypothetical protein
MRTQRCSSVDPRTVQQAAVDDVGRAVVQGHGVCLTSRSHHGVRRRSGRAARPVDIPQQCIHLFSGGY